MNTLVLSILDRSSSFLQVLNKDNFKNLDESEFLHEPITYEFTMGEML